MTFTIPEFDDEPPSRKQLRALAVGIAIGFVSLSPVPKTRELVYNAVGLYDEHGEIDSRSKAVKEAKRESAYAVAGIALGAVGAVLLVLLATVGAIASPGAVDEPLFDALDTFL